MDWSSTCQAISLSSSGLLYRKIRAFAYFSDPTCEIELEVSLTNHLQINLSLAWLVYRLGFRPYMVRSFDPFYGQKELEGEISKCDGTNPCWVRVPSKKSSSSTIYDSCPVRNWFPIWLNSQFWFCTNQFRWLWIHLYNLHCLGLCRSKPLN